jgi:hypothetical protein
MIAVLHEIDRKKAEANMLRMIVAVLVSGALALGAPSRGAAQEQTTATPAPRATTTVDRPLAPGGAAGIKQAQGAQRNGIRNFIPLGIVTGLALLVVFATGDDDNSATTTTGTN